MKTGCFLRLSINDSYNNNMNNVDIADQLCINYHPDCWMGKQKWWWSMLFWGHGTMLVNAFIAYKQFHEIRGKTPLLHYQFCKSVVLAKIALHIYGARKQKISLVVQHA